MMEEYNANQTTLKILGLYSNDYNKLMHVREIARAAKIDVKTAQLQLRKLERINILSSSMNGRNREYRLNLDNLTAKQYMVMAETFTSIRYLQENFLVKKIVDEIGDLIEGVAVLFGSFAKGQATEASDIDIFVIGKKPDADDAVQQTGDRVGRVINIKTSSRKQFSKGLEDKDPLVSEVVSNHIILKGAEAFCDIMWRYYYAR
jgi:predicted nucleotidyltransferase